MSGEFAGKIVVVTGASRGIGFAVARAFAQEGAQTVLAAMSEGNLSAAGKRIAAVGPEPLTVAGDLRELAACESLHARVQERFGRCDILVNNAGAALAGSVLDVSDAQFIDGFALKFFACVRLCRLFWPLLKTSQGHVINVVGGAARSPEADYAVISSVNAASANFSKGLSKLGMRDGVNVNVIHPGSTITERQEQRLAERAAATGKPVEQLREEQRIRYGVRRLGKPEDIAAMALFLCSERARHVQGTAIAVDGGQTAGYY